MLEIRLLNAGDSFDELISLSREFFMEYEAHHQDFFLLDDLKEADIIGYFSSFCGNDSREAFIAVDGDQIVGYITVYVKEQASYWQVKRVGDISGLMVRKDYRHQGIAKRLLERAKEFFAQQAVKYYLVFTSVENRAGLEFYQQNGLLPLYTTLLGEI